MFGVCTDSVRLRFWNIFSCQVFYSKEFSSDDFSMQTPMIKFHLKPNPLFFFKSTPRAFIISQKSLNVTFSSIKNT
jgi:hypothetical protein